MAVQIAVGKQSTVWDLHFSAVAGQSVQWLMIDKNEIAWLSAKLGFTATSSQFAELWTTDEDFKLVEVFRHSNHCFGMVRPVALLGNSFQIRSKSCWDSDQLREKMAYQESIWEENPSWRWVLTTANTQKPWPPTNWSLTGKLKIHTILTNPDWSVCSSLELSKDSSLSPNVPTLQGRESVGLISTHSQSSRANGE